MNAKCPGHAWYIIGLQMILVEWKDEWKNERMQVKNIWGVLIVFVFLRNPMPWHRRRADLWLDVSWGRRHCSVKKSLSTTWDHASHGSKDEVWMVVSRQTDSLGSRHPGAQAEGRGKGDWRGKGQLGAWAGRLGRRSSDFTARSKWGLDAGGLLIWTMEESSSCCTSWVPRTLRRSQDGEGPRAQADQNWEQIHARPRE